MSRPLIAVSVGVSNTDEVLRAMERVARVADVAEIRLDFMSEYDLSTLLRHRPCPVIITHRPEREGGRYQGDERSRIEPLLEAIELGAEHVDIEWDAAELLADVDRPRTRLIVSSHDFERMPDDLPGRYRLLAGKGADVIKLVGMAHDVTDLIPVARIWREMDRPTIAIAMGPVGMASRILSLRSPSCYLTYATLGDGARQVAPGQLAVADLHDVYRVREINAQTVAFGHLAPELPPRDIMARGNTRLREAGMNAVWVPLIATRVEEGTLRTLEALDLAGCSVDAALSGWMAAALDHLTPAARQEGEVDILVRLSDGRWLGHYLGGDVRAWVAWWVEQLASGAHLSGRE
ncbi:MAG TPA: type I 3-dehydroquinate dehydratase [Caldilineae bacterium]|nr:type I 3-dehydroquinate dehydratase [Caldilineae bacterium]